MQKHPTTYPKNKYLKDNSSYAQRLQWAKHKTVWVTKTKNEDKLSYKSENEDILTDQKQHCTHYPDWFQWITLTTMQVTHNSKCFLETTKPDVELGYNPPMMSQSNVENSSLRKDK